MKFYNVDVAEYVDSVQITLYTEPIATDYEREVKDENSGSIFDRIAKNRESDIEIGEQPSAVTSEFDKARSLRRTVQTIYEYSRANVWDYFATFTIADKDVRYDYATAKGKICTWFNNFKKRKCPDLKYLCVPEQHKDGAWHFHALLSGNLDEYIKLNEYGYYNLVPYTLGKINSIEKVRDNGRVASYITKYITKDLLNEVANAQRYFCK
jgi:hypothetical protein